LAFPSLKVFFTNSNQLDILSIKKSFKIYDKNMDNVKPNGEKFIQMLIKLNYKLYAEFIKYDYDIPEGTIITFQPNNLTNIEIILPKL